MHKRLLPAIINISSNGFTRSLMDQNGTLTTIKLVNTRTKTTLNVQSDEFAIKLANGQVITARDYTTDVVDTPSPSTTTIRYTKRKNLRLSTDAPTTITVTFTKTAAGIQKSIHFSLQTSTTPLHIEVERFTTTKQATRGGRGEPVVIGNSIVLLPENPTMLTRHTDGNQPTAYAHRFERVGNHSYIDYAGADQEAKPTPGLVRAFHFPIPQAATSGPGFVIQSQTITGIAIKNGLSAEQTVLRYSRPASNARALTHYNNWFDPDGKDIRGDNLNKTLAAFQKPLAGSGISIDAMVPDNGWQDRRSIWQPAKNLFPNGMQTIGQLGKNLRKSGSALGLWIAADNTTNDVSWGTSAGYKRAKANPYFSQYFEHHSLAQPEYNAVLTSQLKALTDTGAIKYYKFDFNHLSNTIPTDRHGHEAEMDGFIRATRYPKEKGVFINATNWTWHAPGWLNHADTVWLLAGDDGFNANTPELSGRAQASTDRDVYFWRMWGDPADRPWFPISAIMTHGIIRNAAGQMSLATDTYRDWCDYILMHYGRGTLLREWYLSPKSVTPPEWKALIAIHKWADSRRADLINTVYIGGRPDEGAPYGFIGFAESGKTGTVVVRNPAPTTKTITFKLDSTTLFTGKTGQTWSGCTVYPYTMELPFGFTGGDECTITIPAYETIGIELRPGAARGPMVKMAPIVRVSDNRNPNIKTISLAPFATGQRELLVIGYPTLPVIEINGKAVEPTRKTKGAINQFAGYAIDGMPSKTARMWEMAGFDITALTGKEFTVEVKGSESETRCEVHVIAERPIGDDAQIKLSPKTFPGVLREATPVFDEYTIDAKPAVPVEASDTELAQVTRIKLTLDAFGVNAGYGAKRIFVNETHVGNLPACGDQWTPFAFTVPVTPNTPKTRKWSIVVRCANNEDKFKVGHMNITLMLKTGREIVLRSKVVATSHRDWVHFEGSEFTADTATHLLSSPVIALELARPTDTQGSPAGKG